MKIAGYDTHPVADFFPMVSDERLEELVESIKSSGLLLPIVLHDGLVLDGRNRLKACTKAKVEPRFTAWKPTKQCDDPAQWIMEVNAQRRDLSVSQRAMIAVEYNAWREKRNAKERQRAGGGNHGNQHTKKLLPVEAHAPQAPRAPQAREKLAALAGTGSKLIDAAQKVTNKGVDEVKAAVRGGRLAATAAAQLVELPPEKQRAVMERVKQKEGEEVRPGLVRAYVKQEKRAEVARQLESEPVPAPEGPFRVIVSDPPWPYEKRTGDATHRGDLPYPSMSIADICALPVSTFAHDDCVLWLWTTNAFMRDAFTVLDAWGFKEKTILTWTKDKIGLGDWLRGQTEHCILAVRGKPTVTLSNETTSLHAPVREHSRKPDEFFALVERLCPGSKVEMFSRQPRVGWAAWGAETNRFGG